MNSISPSLIALANLGLLLFVIIFLFRGRRLLSSLTVPQRLSLLYKVGFSFILLASISVGIIAFSEGLGAALRFLFGTYMIPILCLIIILFRLPSIRGMRDSTL